MGFFDIFKKKDPVDTFVREMADRAEIINKIRNKSFLEGDLEDGMILMDNQVWFVDNLGKLKELYEEEYVCNDLALIFIGRKLEKK